jgi:hypothetical protein
MGVGVERVRFLVGLMHCFGSHEGCQGYATLHQDTTTDSAGPGTSLSNDCVQSRPDQTAHGDRNAQPVYAQPV